MFKFPIKVMIKEKKNHISLALTMLIVTTVEFMFFELVNHSIITQMPNDERVSMSILTLMVIAFSFFITFYVNSQYIDYKRKELGLLYLSGRNLLDISKYLFIQYLVIFLIVIPLGILLGSLLLPLFYFILNQQFQTNIYLFSYNTMGMIEVGVFVLTKILYIIMINAGFTYRNEIIEILKGTYKKKNKQMMNVIQYGGGSAFKMSFAAFGMIGMDPKERQRVLSNSILEEVEKKSTKQQNPNKRKLLSFIILMGYIFTLVMLCITSITHERYLQYVYANILLLSGMIKIVIPLILGMLSNRKSKRNPVTFVVLNDLQMLFKDTSLPIMVIAIVIPFVISMLSVSLNSNLYRMIACLGYIVITIILAGCLYFKNMIYIESREDTYKILDVMGYDNVLIHKIINREVYWYFILAIKLPLLAMLAQVFQSYIGGGLSLTIALIMIGSYMGVFLILFFIILFQFKKSYRRAIQ